MGGFDSLLLMAVFLKDSSESRKSCSVRSKGALLCLFNEEGGWVIVGWEWGGKPPGESKFFVVFTGSS